MKTKTDVCRNFFPPLQTAQVAYFQRKIHLSVFSAYPDGSKSHSIRISGDLLYYNVRLSSVMANWPYITVLMRKLIVTLYFACSAWKWVSVAKTSTRNMRRLLSMVYCVLCWSWLQNEKRNFGVDSLLCVRLTNANGAWSNATYH